MPLETAKNRMAFQKADPVTGTARFIPSISFYLLSFSSIKSLGPVPLRCSTVDSEHFILH